MEKNFTTRTSLIIGDEGLNKLKNSNVIVFGVGGVGSFAAEAIARAGVGNLTIVDFDEVDITNINRQIPALPPPAVPGWGSRSDHRRPPA